MANGLASLGGIVDTLRSEWLERGRTALLSKPKGLNGCLLFLAAVVARFVNSTISVIMASSTDLNC